MPIVTASSFADPADVVAFKKAIAAGKSEKEAFKVGDNGIGKWGDFTATEDVPMCALPQEDWQAKWGAGSKACHRNAPMRNAARDASLPPV